MKDFEHFDGTGGNIKHFDGTLTLYTTSISITTTLNHYQDDKRVKI